VAITERIEHYHFLRSLGMGQLDLSAVPAAQVRSLAQLAARYDVWALKRFAPAKRYALVTCFLVEIQKTLLDQVVVLHDQFLTALLRKSRNSFERRYRDVRQRAKRGWDTLLRAVEIVLSLERPGADVLDSQLSVDTSWWVRYRSKTNPDFGATFPDAVPSLHVGQHTVNPRSDADLGGNDPTNISDHLKAIAFTAGFHFAFIEQGGTSLYARLAQKVQSREVLGIFLGIGGSEIMHFQTWQDKAGNAAPLTDVDPITGATVMFTDLATNQPETLQANLIFPEPCEFISSSLPACAVIRPTVEQSDAVDAAQALIQDGLFIGQSDEFAQLVFDMAAAADRAGG
jgi:hypothetical protein